MIGQDEYEWREYGRPLTDYERGWIEGVSAYAWWKDGTQFVGTTGTTRRVAIERFLSERPSGSPPGPSLESGE